VRDITFLCDATIRLKLTVEPRGLRPSDSAPILQYGSAPSPDFLAKILCVDTELSLCNTRLYFPVS
jgi:hypothetical protein